VQTPIIVLVVIGGELELEGSECYGYGEPAPFKKL